MKRLATLVLGVALVLVTTLVLAGLPLQRSVALMAEGAFASPYALGMTAVRFAPLCLTTLGVLVAWKAGMYNIGGEGQYLVGGAAGAAGFLLFRHLPAPLVAPLLLACSLLGGAAWAFLAAWLHAKRGVQVVISTILLNFVAIETVSFLVRGPLQHDKRQLPLTESLPNAAMLLRPDPGTPFHSGVVVAALAPFVVWLLLRRTRYGLNLRFVGANPRAAQFQKIPVTRYQVWAMAASGGLCGLAAGVTYTGVTGQVGDGFGQNWGFLAIPAALLAGLEPLAAAAVALVFAALFAGCENLERFTPVGSTLVYVIQAASLLGVVALDRILARKKEATDA